MGVENLAQAGFRFIYSSAHSESLKRIRYPGSRGGKDLGRGGRGQMVVLPRYLSGESE